MAMVAAQVQTGRDMDTPNQATAGAEQAVSCDVAVIGGGPAGSTAAALLAGRGLAVALFEKEVHPRFHVGESLLPRNLAVLERLGLREQVAAMGVRKPGAEFVSDETGEQVAFCFADSMHREYTFSYQVRRAEFDALIFDHARKQGAQIHQGTRVTEFVPPQAGGRGLVVACDREGRVSRFAPRFVLDGSGRDTFIASRLGLKESNKLINNAAVFAHFRGVARRCGDTEGYITVHLSEDGWFWMIPLPDDVMSVGFVGTQAAFRKRPGSIEDLFLERLRTSPTVSARMTEAERISEIRTTGNYSYRARSAWGEGYFMMGDAFAFLDPVFSSGVLLAMTAGEFGADVAAAWFVDPAKGRAAARRAERWIRRAMNRISWLIYRINDPVLRRMFLSPSNAFRMRDALISILGGNLAPDLRSAVPFLAFKAIYHALSVADRLARRQAA